MDELHDRISKTLDKVLIYTKIGCPFCLKAIDLFQSVGVQPVVEDVTDISKVPDFKDALAELSDGNTTLPR